MIQPPIYTLGAVARRIGQPLHLVAYVVRTRQIRETMRVGNLRCFDQAAIDRIRRELEEIAASTRRRRQPDPTPAAGQQVAPAPTDP